jgi:hypothetical protein
VGCCKGALEPLLKRDGAFPAASLINALNTITVQALGLPGEQGHVGVTAKDTRLFVEAVLYRFRAGIAWRDLPSRFSIWHRVYVRFDRWSKKGVWQRVFEQLVLS